MRCLARHPEATKSDKVYVRPLGFWYDVSERRAPKWQAGYPIQTNTGNGRTRTLRVIVEDVESRECPVSVQLRDPAARAMVEMFEQTQACPGGLGEPSKWPGALYDAMSLLSNQQKIDKYARESAR